MTDIFSRHDPDHTGSRCRNASGALRVSTSLALGVLAVFVAADRVSAQEQVHANYEETGTAQDWIAIHAPDSGESGICAIYSRPSGDPDAGPGGLRGELAAFVNWNSSEPSASAGEISFLMGDMVEDGVSEDHTLTIDDEFSVDLVGVDDRLYVMPEDDADVIPRVRGGAQMTVTGVLEDGSVVSDTYSLMGVQAATALARNGCA